MRVVIDTNVLVSALINANGSPAAILSLVLNGNIKVLCDNRILFEYANVLTRKIFGFDSDTVRDLIDYFRHDGEYINAVPINAAFNDEADKKFYEVCKSGSALYLITGNAKHYPKDQTVISPREFLDVYAKFSAK